MHRTCQSSKEELFINLFPTNRQWLIKHSLCRHTVLSVTCAFIEIATWRILASAHHQPISDMAWLTLTLSDPVCTHSHRRAHEFGMDLSFLPAHFRLSVNLLSHNVILSLLLSHRIWRPRMRHHYRLKYIPHMWTCSTREPRDDVPDNNGISKWKRLTNSLNVITLGVDLILWGSGFIVTLIRAVEPSVCLVPNLFKAFPVVPPKWEPLQLMYLLVEGKTRPAHQAKRHFAS